jgi:hypothetical protein
VEIARRGDPKSVRYNDPKDDETRRILETLRVLIYQNLLSHVLTVFVRQSQLIQHLFGDCELASLLAKLRKYAINDLCHHPGVLDAHVNANQGLGILVFGSP